MTLQMQELLKVNEYMKKEELAKCLWTNVRNIIYLKKI